MRTKILCASVALAVLAPQAFAASGTFTFVTGDVSLTKRDGKKITATRGTEVDPGDLIATGGAGMAQLSMIDQARLSLRPNSQFRIEGYQTSAQDTSGAVLNLLRGTLRTFTGLIATTNRDKFVMKTRVATVGIRGSGNILYACSMADGDCDESVADKDAKGDITVNHTIEGSHSISSLAAGDQGGPGTLITGPGQTVLVQGSQPPKFIPTPSFVSDTASNPSNAKAGSAGGGGGGDTRNFAPGDNQQLPPAQQGTGTTPVGNNGLGFVTIDASNNLLSDPQALRDILIATNGPFLGQAPADDVTLENGSALRGYTSYAATGSSLRPAITGGTLAESNSVSVGGGAIVLGRYTGASLGFNGPGSGSPVQGSTHWIYGPSGYPPYLSDVLTGTTSYTLVANTTPTNQNNTGGTLGSARLDVNFTNRTLNLGLSVAIPAAGNNNGGSWNVTATGVPFSLNQFFASTSGQLVIVNGNGISSASNGSLTGAVEGSFVGSSLQGAILGYGINDRTGATSNNNVVSGVAAFTGPAQDGAAPYREGRVSDAEGLLSGSDFSHNYSTTDRPTEITAVANGGITQFVAPAAGIGNRANYTIGTAQVVQSGFDPETGMVWGRWGNGVAQVSSGNTSRNIDLHAQSLHYIFAGAQQGPVALPATGTATYDVIGSTLPTDSSGRVGVLGSATLDANFTNRTVSSTVNVTINNQTWIGSAPNMPIYRDQYFSATTGNLIPGSTNLSPLTISCSPSCPTNPSGSFDGFFTGRNGQRAGLMYNMGGVNGAVAFGRRGG